VVSSHAVSMCSEWSAVSGQQAARNGASTAGHALPPPHLASRTALSHLPCRTSSCSSTGCGGMLAKTRAPSHLRSASLLPANTSREVPAPTLLQCATQQQAQLYARLPPGVQDLQEAGSMSFAVLLLHQQLLGQKAVLHPSRPTALSMAIDPVLECRQSLAAAVDC
jgi:hypothetical protein